MQRDGMVTFGGNWGGRAAEMRGDPARIAALLQRPDAMVLPLWRGKPLVAGEERDRLGWQPVAAPVLALAPDAPLFLGFASGDAGPRFAVDVSRWEPAGLDRAALAMFYDSTEQHHPSLPPDQRFAELRGAMTRLSPEDAALAATARALFNWHRTHGFCARCGAASELAMAGWERQCPTCGARHFPRTDPVVIMLVTRGNRLLLGRSPGWPEGMYSLLAGFVEPGETMEVAVRREVAEEVGVKVGAVRYLASQPWPWPSSLMLGCHAAALDDCITCDDVELEDALWLSREEMVDVLSGTHPLVKPPRAGAIAHYLTRNWLAGHWQGG